MWTDDSLEKSLIQGKIEGRRRRGCQRMSWLDGITDLVNMNLGKVKKMMRDRKAWSAAFHGIAESDTTGWLNNNNKLLASTHWAVYVKYVPVGKSVRENERKRLSQQNICCNVGNTKFMYFAHTRAFRITFCVYLLSLFFFFLIPLAAPDLSCSAQDLLVASYGI